MAIGWTGRIIHFNGETWQENQELLTKHIYVNGFSFKDGVAAICGSCGNDSFIAVGKQK